MSESTFPADLLSSLAANPELLKNAMQMASALASSGMLGGLLGKSAPSGESAPPPPPSAPPSEGGSSVGGGGGGDFAGLLSGLLGNHPSGSGESSPVSQTEAASPFSASPATSPKDSTSNPSKTGKKTTPPCHKDRVQLLKSVRPFLPDDKREKIDFLVQLLELLYSAEQMGFRKLF